MEVENSKYISVERCMPQVALLPLPMHLHTPPTPSHIKPTNVLPRPRQIPTTRRHLLALVLPEVLGLALVAGQRLGLRLAAGGGRMRFVLFGESATVGVGWEERRGPVPTPVPVLAFGLGLRLALGLTLGLGLLQPIDGHIQPLHILTEPRHNPRMRQRLLRGHPLTRLPTQYLR